MVAALTHWVLAVMIPLFVAVVIPKSRTPLLQEAVDEHQSHEHHCPEKGADFLGDLHSALLLSLCPGLMPCSLTLSYTTGKKSITPSW